MSTKYYRQVFNQGRAAKDCGYERCSPYNNCVAEHYWLAGYDGQDFKLFDRVRREAVREERRITKTKLGYSRIGLNNV